VNHRPERLDQELALLARYYDARHGSFQEDVDFYRQLAQGRDLVLELGCGTGRLLAPLAEEARLVVGIDRSAAMLARAQERLRGAGPGPRVSLVAADLRDWACQGAELAVAALNTLSHFTDLPSQERVLASTRRSLRDGGLLALDVPNPHVEMDARPTGVAVLEATYRTPEGTLMEWSVAEVARASQLLTIRSLYDLCGGSGIRRQTTVFDLYLYYLPELTLLLERAGFRVEATWGDYDVAPYRDDSPRLLCLARAV